MTPTRPPCGCRRRRMALLCLALPAILSTTAAPAAQLLRLPELGVQVRMPDGWRVLETRPEAGAVLATDQAPTARVEIVLWRPIASRLTAAAAATAHEQVLAAGLTYTQRSARPFAAADGSEAVLVEGLVQTAEGDRSATVFAAYCIGDRYYVLGAFCGIDETQRVVADYLSDATRTFSALGTRLADPVIAEVPRPGTSASAVPGAAEGGPDPAAATDPTPQPPDDPDPGPAPGPAATIPDAGRPTAAPPATPDPPPPSFVPEDIDLHRDPLGFALAAPAGWTVQIEDGCVTCWPPERPRVGGLVIWPVLSDAAGGEARVQLLARSLAMHLRTTWRTLSTREAAESGRLWVCHGEMIVDDRPLSAVAVLARSENLDVLSLVLVHDSLRSEERLTLARALSAFESVPLWVDAGSSAAADVWIAEDGSLRAEPLPGWEVSGGVVLYNEMPAIEVRGLHRGTGSRFSWRQPELPCLKHPSDRLLAAGWTEGAHFAPDRGVDSLVLAKRVSAVTACRDRTMARDKVGVTEARELLTAGALLPGGEGAYASTETAEMTTTCLGAVAAAPREFGRDCWMVASLMYEASRDTVAATCGALRAFIEGVRILDGWPATEEQAKTLRAAVAGAKEAVRALPPSPGAGDEMAPIVPALSHLVPDGSPEAIQGEVPAELSRFWRLVSREDAARRQLPELLEAAGDVEPH